MLRNQRKKLNRQSVDDFDHDGAQERSEDEEIPTHDDDGDSDEEMEDGSITGSNGDETGGHESDDAESHLNGADTPFQTGGITSVWKAPTTEELANIKAASELFKSNAFRLKIESLLPQVRPKASAKQKIEPFLISLHEHLRSLPSIPLQQPIQAFKRIRKLGVFPLITHPAPTEETKWKVSFEPPSKIQIVGSWPNQLTVIGRAERAFYVDLAVEMPATLFQEKDYLDARFFHKRSYFLATIASSLLKSNLGVDVEYEVPEGNVRRVTLLVRPKAEGKYDFKKLACCVRIIPLMSEDSPIPHHRLSPSHCNLRDPTSDQTPLPTPRYNNDLLLSATPGIHLLLLHLLCSDVPAFRDAVTLLRVWANQRGYGPSNSAIAGFDGLLCGTWWSFLIAYLIWGDDETSLVSASGTGPAKRRKRRTIGKNLSSYQLFRAVLDLLASHDFVSEPVRVRTPTGKEAPGYGVEAHGLPVFTGPSSLFNFLGDIPISSIQLLRHDARCTLQALDSTSVSDGFEAVFMQDLRDLQQRFDSVIRIDLSNALFARAPVDHSTKAAAAIEKLDTVLRRALGARARQIAIVKGKGITNSFPVSQGRPHSEDSSHVVYVGLLLDSEYSTKLVEHGPPAEDTKECENFRQFWGDKSELRRFNDGRIVESVVWELTGELPNERFQIPARIVRYIVERHLGISLQDITILDAVYDGLLSISPDIIGRYSTLSPSTAPEAVQRMALTTFDELVNKIKAMEKLPLNLVNAVPVDESLRYSSCLLPIPLVSNALHSLSDCSKYIPTIEIVLQFEQSTRWPDSLEAIQKVKVALLDAIAQGLLAQGAPHAIVAWDGNDQPSEDHVALEVILDSGFAFRARVRHDRERTLMERIISDGRGMSECERRKAQAALERHTRRFTALPAHHAAVLSLQRRCPSYSHAVRLVKRWISAHWLSPHITAEAAELICAEVYMNTGAQESPCSGQAGFARTISFLANWDFRESPIALPLYTAPNTGNPERVSLASEVLTKVQELFASHISTDPGLSHGAWTLATEEDHSGHLWTKNVTALIAGRVREIAKATASYMSASNQVGPLDAKGMFAHPTTDYDFIIYLKPSVVTRYTQNLFANPSVWGSGTKYANIRSESSASVYGDAIRLDFDPVNLFIRELQRLYGDSIVWFHDCHGGTSIGGVWNPRLSSERPFRVLLGFSSQPSPDSSINKKLNVTLNKAAILAEIERLGSGLILNIS